MNSANLQNALHLSSPIFDQSELSNVIKLSALLFNVHRDLYKFAINLPLDGAVVFQLCNHAVCIVAVCLVFCVT